jgi:alpha-mannosidase
MQSVGNGAGEFTDVQQPTMDGFEKLSQYNQPWALVSSGPVRDIYSFTKEINHVTVEQQIMLYKTIKRIDVRVNLKGFDGTRYREFRLAFPVNQSKSEIAYEVPMGVVQVGKDEISGAAGFSYPSQIYDTPCTQVHPREVQDWFSASDRNLDMGITISSDVAVFDWIDPTTSPEGYTILQPILLASRKSCHGSGNYYLQPGNHTYTFSIYSHRGGWKNGYRQGSHSNQPLMAVTVRDQQPNAIMPETMSFISVENKNLIISAVKKCDDDDQVVIRCYDIEGKDTEAKILLFKPYQQAELTNMIEEEGKTIPGQGNILDIKIGHHAIETIKLHVN